jgi:membrane protein involved in colicin uptake
MEMYDATDGPVMTDPTGLMTGETRDNNQRLNAGQRQTERQTDREGETVRGRQMVKQRERQRKRRRDKVVYRERERETEISKTALDLNGFSVTGKNLILTSLK